VAAACTIAASLAADALVIVNLSGRGDKDLDLIERVDGEPATPQPPSSDAGR
jgi:tryptophan synthase beta subunit